MEAARGANGSAVECASSVGQGTTRTSVQRTWHGQTLSEHTQSDGRGLMRARSVRVGYG
jgi:hypothetical protein